LLLELNSLGLEAKNQVPIPVYYKGKPVGDYFADIVVGNRVIIELKAIKQLDKVHEAQLLNYLKATNYKVGLLVNFSHDNAKIKRFVL